ncbi:MAG: hypothetical protein V3T72_11720 [Thermoanaerobaculia bacterium]
MRSVPTTSAPAAWLIAAAVAAASTAAVTQADWLVTRDGAKVETRGAWEVRGRMVIFTQPGGTLSSMRLAEVDLDASRAATEAAAAPPPPAPAEEKPRPSVLTLTDDDVGRGEPGVQGRQLLIERLRNAHRFKDVGLAMTLVSLQGTPPAVRDAIRKELEGLMERQIRGIEMVAFEGGGDLEEVAEDGVTYRPNIGVTHRLVVELEPDDESQRLTTSFYVGERLGQYFIAAARIAGQ